MKNKALFIIMLFLLITILPISEVRAEPELTLVYVVQEGDTLYDIARDYGTNVDTLLKINNIDNDEWIKVGDELIIPKGNSNKQDDNSKWSGKLFSEEISNESDFYLERNTTYSIRVNERQPLPEVNIPPHQIITYHVGVGDTLFDLARSFNTSTGVIMALNNMDDSIIRAGETLQLPINNLTAQEVIARTITQDEIELLARTIHGEARGEPYIGQVAVGAVVINRVLSSYFPDSFSKVIYQSGQFSAVADGQIKLNPNRTAYKAAKEAINGKDPTMGALYYYNPKIAKNKNWFSKREMVVTIGDHVFAK